jgi:hypothetical protein
MGKRAQAALEFLTTYAWAFVVILITIASLYYFGVFDFSRFVPEKCQFSPQFACTDFVITSDSVSVKMANTLGESLNITTVQITSDAASPLSCTSPLNPPSESVNPGMNWESGIALDLNFTSCFGGGLIAGERIDARVRMVYHAKQSPSKTPHSIQGSVSGQVLSG